MVHDPTRPPTRPAIVDFATVSVFAPSDVMHVAIYALPAPTLPTLARPRRRSRPTRLSLCSRGPTPARARCGARRLAILARPQALPTHPTHLTYPTSPHTS